MHPLGPDPSGGRHWCDAQELIATTTADSSTTKKAGAILRCDMGVPSQLNNLQKGSYTVKWC